MNIKVYNFPQTIWPYFSHKRKKQIFFAIFLMLLSSLAELISTASVFPFLYVVTSSPESLWENELIRNMKLLGCKKISELNRNNIRFRNVQDLF